MSKESQKARGPEFKVGDVVNYLPDGHDLVVSTTKVQSVIRGREGELIAYFLERLDYAALPHEVMAPIPLVSVATSPGTVTAKVYSAGRIPLPEQLSGGKGYAIDIREHGLILIFSSAAELGAVLNDGARIQLDWD